jgi:hypothetical protein
MGKRDFPVALGIATNDISPEGVQASWPLPGGFRTQPGPWRPGGGEAGTSGIPSNAFAGISFVASLRRAGTPIVLAAL